MTQPETFEIPANLLSDDGLGKVRAWLERNLGGEIGEFKRQPRWRPMYFVDVEVDGRVLPLLIRGDRPDVPLIFPLEHEMLTQRLIQELGVASPKIYGWCEDPRCIIMERVAGVPHFDGVSPEGRRAVMRDYMKALAELHRLPVAPFKAAGVHHAATPDEAHLIGQRRFEKIYRATKKRPDPFLEFVLGWLARHPLKRSYREAVVCWDSGQFHQQDGQFVSLVDLEIAHVGDPMLDLAGFRMRDTVLGFGDFNELYAIYEEYSGEPVDLEAIKHHHLFFTMANALSFHTALAEPAPGSDYMTNLQWVNETNRFALEALAEYLDLELPEISVPEPEETAASPQIAHMVRFLRNVKTDDTILAHELRSMFRLSRQIQRWDQVGRKVVEADLDDMAPLLGRRPASWQDGQAALEAYVLADAGAHDIELIQLFNRRTQRAQSLNGPPGSPIARHNPIQRFGR